MGCRRYLLAAPTFEARTAAAEIATPGSMTSAACRNVHGGASVGWPARNSVAAALAAPRGLQGLSAIRCYEPYEEVIVGIHGTFEIAL